MVVVVVVAGEMLIGGRVQIGGVGKVGRIVGAVDVIVDCGLR